MNTIKIADNQPHSWPLVYLHGKLERAHKFDISNFSEPKPTDGIYACSYNGMHCIAFLWTTDTGHTKGLVVAIDSPYELIYAYQMYVEKAASI